MVATFLPIIDTPKDRFIKIWKTLWFVRAYRALYREFAPPKLPIKFPMNERERELNRKYYTENESAKSISNNLILKNIELKEETQ